MRKWIISMWIILVLFMVTGCTPEQMQQADNVIADVNTAATEAGNVTNSAAGLLIPEPYRTAIGGIAFLLTGLAGAWAEWRIKTKPLTQVTRAIVNGINESKADATIVKQNIKTEMLSNGILKRGDVIVEQLKR